MKRNLQLAALSGSCIRSFFKAVLLGYTGDLWEQQQQTGIKLSLYYMRTLTIIAFLLSDG